MNLRVSIRCQFSPFSSIFSTVAVRVSRDEAFSNGQTRRRFDIRLDSGRNPYGILRLRKKSTSTNCDSPTSIILIRANRKDAILYVGVPTAIKLTIKKENRKQKTIKIEMHKIYSACISFFPHIIRRVISSTVQHKVHLSTNPQSCQPIDCIVVRIGIVNVTAILPS